MTIKREVWMPLTCIALLAGTCFLSAQVPAGEPEQEVIAKGIGAIIAGDEAKAQDDALGNALRNAVEQVVGTMIQSEVLVRNYQVMEDRIYSRTDGFVRSYQVISNRKQSETIWETTIRAVVSRQALESDLAAAGILMARKGKPRLMVLVDELNMGQHYYAYHVDLSTTENELISQLSGKGYTFVDKNVVAQKLNRDAVNAAIEGNVNTAQAIAQESGAEVLIIGKAISKAASGGPAVLRQSGMVSCQATLNLKAVRADDGTIIASTSQMAPAAHIDQMTGGTLALKKATELAATELNRRILSVWQEDVYSGTTIQLRLMDVASFNDLVKFKAMLQTHVRGVQNVFQRSYSANTAVLDIRVRGNASQVAEELVAKDFSPYRVEVINAAQNSIVARLVTAQ